MRPMTAAPYADLTPQTVLDALDAVGLRGDGRLLQLNSYENRVFMVHLEDGRAVVAKFYRPGRWSDAQILEEHGFAAELEAQEIPLAAPLMLALDATAPCANDAALIGPTLARLKTAAGEHRYCVTPRQSGRAPELEDEATLEWIGRFIGRIHVVGATAPFAHRLTMDVATFGTGPRDWLLEERIVSDDVATAWHGVTTQALAAANDAFACCEDLTTIRLHGDCHAGNLLWTEAGPHFVDLDDAVNGPAVQDLWMLLAGDRATARRQLSALLAGYETFREFDWRELRLVEALRTLRIIHHSAWIARRWEDPAFPIAFPWFASPAYWADQTTRLREQLDAMAEPSIGGL